MNWKRQNWGQGTNVPIHWCISNLKNTHVGAHQRVPRQPYIWVLMDHPYLGPPIYNSITVQHSFFTQKAEVLYIHRSAINTSELQCSNMHSDVWLGLYDPKIEYPLQGVNQFLVFNKLSERHISQLVKRSKFLWGMEHSPKNGPKKWHFF